MIKIKIKIRNGLIYDGITDIFIGQPMEGLMRHFCFESHSNYLITIEEAKEGYTFSNIDDSGYLYSIRKDEKYITAVCQKELKGLLFFPDTEKKYNIIVTKEDYEKP